MSNEINISPKNVQGKCDNKCSYEFEYNNTNLVATNIGTLIMLKCDNAPKPQVIYNSEKYTTNFMFIATPSIHKFNDSTTDAELLIEHECVTGGDKLIVCIPIIKSSNSNTATSLITEVINNVAANAPKGGESTNINMSDFNINSIVPSKPFYAYTGNDMHGQSSNFIVFGVIDAIPLNDNVLSRLNNIIKTNSIQATGGSIYYNSSGPGKKNDEGIYISCKPTGSSTDQTTVVTDNPSDSSDSLWNDPNGKMAIEVLLGILGFLFFFSMLNYAYVFMTDKPIRLPAVFKKQGT
uniref:Alpha-carbonic anhydrase domain-containing protein n=1 Tax=viral metagenome TaxID=1070528 RepID=A0A6C0LK90_9ZZZZ